MLLIIHTMGVHYRVIIYLKEVLSPWMEVITIPIYLKRVGVHTLLKEVTQLQLY